MKPEAEESANRLWWWIAQYWHTKQPEFIADLKAVLEHAFPEHSQPAEDPQPVEVTDRRGVVLVPGQKVFVLQAEQTRLATVVEVSESRSSNGWWVDVDFGCGPEGVPSDTLEVCNAPPQPAEDPDEWVIQNRVPRRVKVDQFVYLSPREMSLAIPEESWQFFRWSSGCPAGEIASDGRKHGFVTVNGNTLHVRCRRRDLPKVEQKKTTDDFGMYLESVIAKDPQLKAEVDAAEAELAAIDARLNKPEPQPQKTRVRLWKNSYGSVMSNPDCEHIEGWQEIHYDAEGFYTID